MTREQRERLRAAGRTKEEQRRLRAARAGASGLSPTAGATTGGRVPPGAVLDPVVQYPLGEAIEPEVVSDELPAERRTQGESPGLSPVGRTAVGAAIGATLFAAFELPGGLVAGGLAGAVLGYFVPVPQMGGTDE